MIDSICNALAAEFGLVSSKPAYDPTTQPAAVTSARTSTVSPPLKPSNMSEANKTQVAGSHYKTKTIQPWDFIASNRLGYFEGNIVKYVSRWQDKGGVDDLRKAAHYLQKLIELQTAVPNDKDRCDYSTSTHDRKPSI
jgi:hypothetical protein